MMLLTTVHKTVQEHGVELQLLITVIPVMLMLLTTAYKIVQVHGAVLLKMMNAVYVMVIIVVVQTVLVCLMVIQC